MKTILKDKRILFIGPKFFDYHLKIYEEIRSFGAIVTYFPDKPNNSIHGFLNSYFEFFKKKYEKKYLDSILKKVKKIVFDYIFVIKGECISVEFIEILKCNNLRAKFILYQWDSLSNFNYFPLIEFFEIIYSFDIKDVKENNQLRYLPLFYNNEYSRFSVEDYRNNKINDLFFIGGVHGDRYDIVMKLLEQIKGTGLKFKYYLYLPPLVFLKTLIKGYKYKLKHIHFSQLTHKQIIKEYRNANAVLDINNPEQNGLTMRTFEVLSMYRKLVTTNSNIKREEFYNNINIHIIDRSNISLDINFLKNEFMKIPFEKYSINNWIKKIFDVF